MSLDNYYPNTEEKKRKDDGEKLEDTDRNLKEIKLLRKYREISDYFEEKISA